MNSKQNESQPSAQAGWSREAVGVAGEVGVLHSSVDLWESTTHGEPREGRGGGGGSGGRWAGEPLVPKRGSEVKEVATARES